MRLYNKLPIVAAALLVACAGSTSDAPFTTEIGTTSLSITTEKPTYSVSGLSSGNEVVRATLTAAPDKPYYARLGDAFNGNVDQNPLYIAEGSDGLVERQSGANWEKASSQILVEGVREVVLTPGKSYSLFATLSTPIKTGVYRLTVLVSDAAGGAKTTLVRSATFEVR